MITLKSKKLNSTATEYQKDSQFAFAFPSIISSGILKCTAK